MYDQNRTLRDSFLSTFKFWTSQGTCFPESQICARDRRKTYYFLDKACEVLAYPAELCTTSLVAILAEDNFLETTSGQYFCFDQRHPRPSPVDPDGRQRLPGSYPTPQGTIRRAVNSL